MSVITLYTAPPTTTEVGAAYVRLALGVAHHYPGLLHHYWGPATWAAQVAAEPPTLPMLREHAVAVATAVQKSDLPRNRRERLLRNVRALLWLIRAALGEQIIFREQVRMLLDLQPEGASAEVLETAHATLALFLPGDAPLVERWQTWQADHTRPAQTVLPLFQQAMHWVQERWVAAGASVAATLSITAQEQVALLSIPAQQQTAPLHYDNGCLALAPTAALRVDRLAHLAVQWGWGGLHSLAIAATQRYAQGETESALLLQLGPDQVWRQGAPQAWLATLQPYRELLPTLLAQAGIAVTDPEAWQAIHLAEDALSWAKANAALLLHSEGLRPRALRRRLMADALINADEADAILAAVGDPITAAHLFAPLLGGPLVQAWLNSTGAAFPTLLVDPPVPSTMIYELRFR